MRMLVPVDARQPTSATASNAAYRISAARAGAAYAVDGLNRMTSTTGTTLVYDALDRLNQVVSGVGTKFLYEGQQIIAEYNGSGALQRRYIPGPGLDNPYVWFEGTGTASSTARWLLGNAFGSIIAVGSTGAANTTLAINQYDEFGVGPTSNLGRFQYKGMAYIPEVGLYHARARTYSQYLGRFMQIDPSGYSDGMNLYAFVHNAPVGSSDPQGLGCFSYQMQISHPPITVYGPNGEIVEIISFPYGDEWHQVCYDGPNSFPNIGQPGGGGGGHQTPPQSQTPDPCAHNAVAKWLYDNVSGEAGADAGMGLGVSGSVDLSLKEVGVDGGLGLMQFGAEAHAGVNVQLAGPGVENGFFGESQFCIELGLGGTIRNFVCEAV